MEDKTKLIDTLIERATDYVLTRIEILKLQTIDRISSVVSSLVPQIVVCIIFLSFLLFLNLGIAFWLGEVLGRTFYGFLAVAAFYLILGLALHLFMRKSLRKTATNFIIRTLLK